jgi:GNAT superfamily N-acetyltransferase
MALGHKGLVAIHQGQLAGYAWGCTVVNPKLERVHLKLEPDDVFCMDVYTAPVFRGQGVQTALTLARFRMFRDMGCKRAICNIERKNAPSLSVWQKKFGSLTLGRIDYIRIGTWHRVRYYQETTG